MKFLEFGKRFTARFPGLWQFVKYSVVSWIVGIADMACFLLGRFLLFRRFEETAFSWFIFRYSVEEGGYCAFLAFVFSFVTSQTLNYILQRKVTFQANNNLTASILWYLLMLVLAFAFTTWFPTVITVPVCRLAGNRWGAPLVKFLTQTASVVIYYPMSKWLVMRKTEAH